MIARRLVWALAWVAVSVAAAAPAGAQTIASAPGPPTGERGLLPRYQFFLEATHLGGGGDDLVSFVWDAHFGGDLDLVDYGLGRLTAQAAFETILGTEFRDFDPNQGNYILGLSGSYRVRRTEVAAVFHHVSRHLSDRPKRESIDWNMAGIRVQHPIDSGALRLVLTGRSLWTVARSFVDYSAEIGGDIEASVGLNAVVSVIAHGAAYSMLTVDDSARGNQTGGLIQGGVRVAGAKGVVDFYAGYERRVDADPFSGEPHNWFVAGFRLLSR